MCFEWFLLFCLFGCVLPVCVLYTMHVQYFQIPENGTGSLALKLWTGVSCRRILGIEPGSSRRAVGALDQ